MRPVVSVTTALGEIFETTTDANGDFEFVGLPPGRYTLSSAPKSGGDPLRTAPPSGAEAVSDRVVYFTESSILVELKKGGQVEVRFLLDPGH